LIAARLTAKTPFAEVLAIVGQQPIAILTHSGARAPDDFSRIEVRRDIESDPGGSASGETIERGFFDRPSAQAVDKSRVVDDLSFADVYSVVQIPATRRDDV
jgi:hypothetical protein